MKPTHHDFTPPTIVGALGDATMDARFARAYEREFRAQKVDAACLPFRVERRYLKNIIACMKLMDVAGIIVHPSHAIAIVRHLPSLDRYAREAGFVDVIVRRGTRFVGLNAFALAVLEFNRTHKHDVRTVKPTELDRLRRKICGELIFR
jgi:shikimate 5-dehydrogenase